MSARWVVVGCLLALGAARAEAQEDFQVHTGVDARRIGQQDTVEFKIEVKGTGFTSVDPPDLTGLRDFEVLDGPRRVQRQSIVNGQFSAAVELLWTLGPRRTGRMTVPALPFRVDGKPFRSAPLDVQVVEGSVATRVPSTGRSGSRRGVSGEVLLVADVDRRRVYVGQQVRFTLKLLTQLAVRGMAYKTHADFSGFWTEKEFDYVDDPPTRIDGNPVTHDGRSFNEYLLAQVALFPTASGTVELGPVNLQLRVRSDRNNRLGSFFFDREHTILRRSAPLSIEVMPLPSEGRPETFSGAVGTFRLEVATDRDESVVNDAVSLSVRVSGAGNIRAAREPLLPPLGDFRPFDPTVSETEGFRDGLFRGSRTWEYVLVPLAPGDQTIPPISFSYFDPRAERYRTLQSEPIPLRIARGEGPELPRTAGLTRRAVTALRQDIHFIKLAEGGLRDQGSPLHRSGAYLALLAMPLFLNAALLAWRVRSDRLQADVARRRSLGARAAFRTALGEARAAFEGDDAVSFHAALARAVTGIVADKSNLAAAGLTRERIADALDRAGVEKDVRHEVGSILDACDAARFASATADATAMRELAERTEAVGRRLEGMR